MVTLALRSSSSKAQPRAYTRPGSWLTTKLTSPTGEAAEAGAADTTCNSPANKATTLTRMSWRT